MMRTGQRIILSKAQMSKTEKMLNAPLHSIAISSFSKIFIFRKFKYKSYKKYLFIF